MNFRLEEKISYKNFNVFEFKKWLIANNAKSNKLEDQIFWYKASAHNEFKLGSKEFWEMSKDLASDDEDEQYDPNQLKKGPRINVKKNKW